MSEAWQDLVFKQWRTRVPSAGARRHPKTSALLRVRTSLGDLLLTLQPNRSVAGDEGDGTPGVHSAMHRLWQRTTSFATSRLDVHQPESEPCALSFAVMTTAQDSYRVTGCK